MSVHGVVLMAIDIFIHHTVLSTMLNIF
uniref:Uncharacterized protein n=1 Tax=Anguilla anguilla TaxID=7936 RepID=A0A0E9QZY3_ANGAN